MPRKAGSYDDGSQGGDGQWKVTLRKYPSNICPQLQTYSYIILILIYILLFIYTYTYICNILYYTVYNSISVAEKSKYEQ